MTVLITLTTAGTDTGPFDLYSNVDGYVSAFETGVSKAALQAGYSSSLVPNGATIIRVKSTGVCTNYVDIPVSTTTTTTSSTTSTTTTSIPPTTTTTTTVFACGDCRNWEYNGATIPAEGDVISYYSCLDGSPQSIALSNGDPTGNFCNCDSIDNPSSLNGTTLTQIGICGTTTTTTTGTPPPTTTTTTTLFTNLVFDLTTGAGGYTISAINVEGVTPTLTGGTDVPFNTDTHSYNTNQIGLSQTLNITISPFVLNGCITVTDSASVSYQQNITSGGLYSFPGLVINYVTPVTVLCADNAC